MQGCDAGANAFAQLTRGATLPLHWLWLLAFWPDAHACGINMRGGNAHIKCTKKISTSQKGSIIIDNSINHPAEEVEVANADERRRYACGHSTGFFDRNLFALGHDALFDGVLQRRWSMR